VNQKDRQSVYWYLCHENMWIRWGLINFQTPLYQSTRSFNLACNVTYPTHCQIIQIHISITQCHMIHHISRAYMLFRITDCPV